MQVKISQAVRMIGSYLKARLVPLIKGSPGCGKSQVVHQIAAQYNLKVIDLRLSQCDPTDLTGFPTIVGNKADYVPMAHFPVEGDTIPAGYKGWLLFLDELTSAPPAIQAASYKLILDRMVGTHELHKNVAIVAAGNLETDGAIVQSLSTALQSRLVHMELVVCPKEWSDWAERNGVDGRVTSYIKFKPDMLFNFKADHTGDTYACPRTWEFVSRLMKAGDASEDQLELLAGTIDEGAAREFLGFTRIYDSLPKISQIEAAPLEITVPHEPSILFAMCGAIAQNMTKLNVESLMKYLARIPAEFQVITMREVARRQPPMLANPYVQKWVNDSAMALF